MTRFEQHIAESLREHQVAPPPSLREDVFAALDATSTASSGKSRRWGWAIFCGVALAGSGAIWLTESNAPASTASAPVSVPASASVPVSDPVPVPVSDPVPVSVSVPVSVPVAESPAASSSVEPTLSMPAVVENASAEKPADLEVLDRRSLQPIATETLDAATPLTAGEETWHINASVTIKQ